MIDDARFPQFHQLAATRQSKAKQIAVVGLLIARGRLIGRRVARLKMRDSI